MSSRVAGRGEAREAGIVLHVAGVDQARRASAQAIGEGGRRVAHGVGLDDPADPQSLAAVGEFAGLEGIAERIDPRLPETTQAGHKRASPPSGPRRAGAWRGAWSRGERRGAKRAGRRSGRGCRCVRKTSVISSTRMPARASLADVTEADIEQNDVAAGAHGVARGSCARPSRVQDCLTAASQNRRIPNSRQMIKYIR